MRNRSGSPAVARARLGDAIRKLEGVLNELAVVLTSIPRGHLHTERTLVKKHALGLTDRLERLKAMRRRAENW